MTQKQPEELTVSTGVVFRLRTPSAWAQTNVQRQMARTQPQPPIVHIEEKGRDEPNPADPAYLEALGQHELTLRERLYEVTIATGTEVLSVPDGFPTVEDESWRKTLLGAGVELSDNPDRRYIEWVKYCAAPANEDWLRLYSPLLRRVGTPEEDVAEATKTFRRDEERPADSGDGPR